MADRPCVVTRRLTKRSCSAFPASTSRSGLSRDNFNTFASEHQASEDTMCDGVCTQHTHSRCFTAPRCLAGLASKFKPINDNARHRSCLCRVARGPINTYCVFPGRFLRYEAAGLMPGGPDTIYLSMSCSVEWLGVRTQVTATPIPQAAVCVHPTHI